MKHSVFCVAFAVVAVVMVSSSDAQDTDGDGLLDLIDVPGFDPNQTGSGRFMGLGIQDLDGANMLIHLSYLFLTSNYVTSIEAGDFDGLDNLEFLEISDNPIMSIERGDFQGLTNLEYLGLFGGEITCIESGGFDGLYNLQSLDLGQNLITSLEYGDFEGLTNLRSLRLTDNGIAGLESGGFEGLANLQSLSLPGNQIASIESQAFRGLANLQSLNLAVNQIASIESQAFRGLANLESLDLSRNYTTNIASGAFYGLNNLRTVVLNGSRLSAIDLTAATFSHLERCHRMDRIWQGFCLRGFTATSLALDNALLSLGSFEAIIGEMISMTDVSLIGLRFADTTPENLTQLLEIATLDNVTVDQFLFDLYADEFNAFDALPGNTVTVVPEPNGAILAMLLFGLLFGMRNCRRAITR